MPEGGLDVKNKNTLFLCSIIVLFALLCGCSNIKTSPKSGSSSGISNKLYTIKDYYPFNANYKYTYEGKGMEYSAYTSWVDYISGDRIQLRINNGGTETARVIENKNGKLKIVFDRNECYYRENFTSKSSNKDEILLQEPLAKGTSWNLSDGRKRYISNVDVQVSTPSGTYKALEVTTEDGKNKTLDYYALNAGLVKSIFSSGDSEISSSLSKIEKDSSLTQNVKFYYPGKDGSKIYYKNIVLSFKTNDITKLSFEKTLKSSPSANASKVLGPNVKISSMYLNTDNMVYADFSKELITEMNAGAGYEQLILQSIVNTIGNYYGVNKVYLTVESKPYSSGHILLKKGEFFTVASNNYIELKE